LEATTSDNVHQAVAKRHVADCIDCLKEMAVAFGSADMAARSLEALLKRNDAQHADFEALYNQYVASHPDFQGCPVSFSDLTTHASDGPRAGISN